MRNPIIFVLCILLIIACQQESPEKPGEDEGQPDTSVTTAPPSQDTLPVSDTTDLDDENGEKEAERQPDRQTPANGQNSGGQAPTKNWTIGIIEREHEISASGLVKDIRVGGHDGFERIVIEFENQLPSYHIEYVDEPYIQCGSGNQLWLTGDALLKISFFPAMAHNEKGERMVQSSQGIFFPIIKEVEIACDYEGEVTVLAGVGEPKPFAATEFRGPARLVVDIRR